MQGGTHNTEGLEETNKPFSVYPQIIAGMTGQSTSWLKGKHDALHFNQGTEYKNREVMPELLVLEFQSHHGKGITTHKMLQGRFMGLLPGLGNCRYNGNLDRLG